MIASIFSKEERSAGSIVSFSIDENNFNKSQERIVTRTTALDKTVYLTDWGFVEGNRIIRMSNILVSKGDFDILEGMQEDNTSDFYFAHRNNLWSIIFQEVDGNLAGNNYLISITLAVIEAVDWEE